MYDPDKKEIHFQDVTGVLLAGGRSLRMGRDKALLMIGDTPMYERVMKALGTCFPRVLIAGDRPDLVRPGIPCFPDLFPGSALGGLYTGLFHADTPWIFAAACDMPFADASVISALLQRREGAQAVVPKTPRGAEPLFALYSRDCLDPIRSMLQNGDLKIQNLFNRVAVRFVEPRHISALRQDAFINVNSPEDLRFADKRMAAREGEG